MYVYTASLNTYNNEVFEKQKRFKTKKQIFNESHVSQDHLYLLLSSRRNLFLLLWTVCNVLLLHCGLKYLAP